MKLLSDVSLTENEVNTQLKVNQTISKINTLMDVADGLKEWEGVQRIEIFLRIENKLIDLIDDHPIWTLYYCFLITLMLLFYFITGCLKLG